MNTEELKVRKKALGYTNKMISELSGVPLGTVNKIFSGATDAPRYDTLHAIESVLRERKYHKEKGRFVYNFGDAGSSTLRVEENVLATVYNVQKAPGEYTVEDFDALPDDCRMELIEGNFYDLGWPTLPHQIIAGEIFGQIYNCLSAHPEKRCRAFMTSTAVNLVSDNRTVVVPDLTVVCGPEALSDPAHITGAPDFVLEVLSPSNRDHDLVLKCRLYRENGVKEYWIADPESERLLVYYFPERDLPISYTFDQVVPVGVSDGVCSIDFRCLKDDLSHFRR